MTAPPVGRTPSGEYEPTPAHGVPILRAAALYLCPRGHEVKPKDLVPWLNGLCPSCARDILAQSGVPRLRAVSEAPPAETSDQARAAVRRKPDENKLSTRRIPKGR